MPPRKRGLAAVPEPEALKTPKPAVQARSADRMRAAGIIPPAPVKSRKQNRQPGDPRSNPHRRHLENGPFEDQTWHEIDEATAEPTGRTEIRKRPIPYPEERRCRAIVKRGQWSGNRCCAWAIRGGVVCRAHGGNMPSVKKAAQRRLAMAADPAAAKLIHIALNKPGVEDRDRIKALLAILDRAGIGGNVTIELEVKPWQDVLRRIAGRSASAEGGVLELEEGVDYTVDDEDEVDDD